MATLHEISDPADPRLGDYRDLRDVQMRKHLEAEHGLFLAEGEKVVRRAVEAGFTPRSFLMAPRWLDGLADVLGTTDAPCYVMAESLAEEVTGFHVHRGALASLERRPLPTVAEVLDGARSVLVLEDIIDHTNVGAILRSGRRARLRRRAARAALRRPALPAFDQGRDGRGVHDAVDPAAGLVRRAAVALGGRASPPWRSRWPTTRPRSRRRSPGSTRWRWCSAREGHGLSARWEQSADRRAIIPMREGIDSLNVAAATAVACYVTARR